MTEPTMTSPRLEVRCRAGRGDFELDVSLGSGGSLGLFGPSGAGKSTLLRALAGLDSAEELRLAVDGEVLVNTRGGAVPPAHRRGVGLVFQDHRLFPHRSVAANLRYGLRGAPKKGPGGVSFHEVVELLGLGALLKRLPSRLSGGEQQRVAIGRALLSGPRLLALDEPLASLDRGLKLAVLPFLRRAAQELSVPLIFVSHDLGDLLAVTDTIALMDAGRIVGHGPLRELVQSPEHLNLLHDCGLVFQVSGRVERRDPSGLVWVRHHGDAEHPIASVDGGHGQGPGPGDEVDLLMRPEDVVLALPPCDAEMSLTNRLPGAVVSITRAELRTLVTLDCGVGAPIFAEVTERSRERLGLEPGKAVIAMMKAQAMTLR